MIRLIATILCCLTTGNALYAQTEKEQYMPLHRTESGHYAFYALLNDKVMCSVMIESGISAAIIDSAFVFKHLKELGIKVYPNNKNKEMNLGGNVYHITHCAKGNLPMGNMTYKGEILILANYQNDTPITLPIQNLHHRSDWNSRIIMLDLDAKKLQALTRNELQQWQNNPKYKINHNTYKRMPAVRSRINLITAEGEAVLEGNFNIDLGNPIPLYLRLQSKKVAKLLDNNGCIKLHNSTSRSGKAVRTIKTTQFGILDRTFDYPVIGITDKLPQFTTEGLIGLPFFKGCIAVFDFENNFLYMQEQKTTGKSRQSH